MNTEKHNLEAQISYLEKKIIYEMSPIKAAYKRKEEKLHNPTYENISKNLHQKLPIGHRRMFVVAKDKLTNNLSVSIGMKNSEYFAKEFQAILDREIKSLEEQIDKRKNNNLNTKNHKKYLEELKNYYPENKSDRFGHPSIAFDRDIYLAGWIISRKESVHCFIYSGRYNRFQENDYQGQIKQKILETYVSLSLQKAYSKIKTLFFDWDSDSTDENFEVHNKNLMDYKKNYRMITRDLATHLINELKTKDEENIKQAVKLRNNLINKLIASRNNISKCQTPNIIKKPISYEQEKPTSSRPVNKM